MTVSRIAAIAMISMCACSMHSQSSPVIHHGPNFDAERKQADDLYTKGFRLQALPLYTDLSRQDPTIAVFAERRGSGLIAAADIESDDGKRKALNDEAMAEFRRAKSLGDNTPAVLTMLGMEQDRQQALKSAAPNGSPAGLGAPENMLSSNPEARSLMREAETAFAKNDNDLAFSDFKKASELDPNSYYAKLYAGDACFRKGDYACAGEWFAKAIALDPNTETAYRYWGDALYKGGHSKEAKLKYEQAIVANPYTRLSWNGLAQWGQFTKTPMGSPPIQRPAVTKSGQGTSIALPSGPPADIAAWTLYAGCRADSDRSRAAGARRTAAEEMHCLDLAADFAAKQDKLDSASAGLQALVALKRDGMLECWLLLNGADQEVLKDYPIYRDAHRDVLIAYIDKYVIHS